MFLALYRLPLYPLLASARPVAIVVLWCSANGQAKPSNKGIIKLIKRNIEENPK